MKKIITALAALMAMLACQKEEPLPGENNPANTVNQYLNLPETPFNYANQNVPNHIVNDPGLMAADNTPFNNPVTDDGATLGRVLFYDKNLSLNKTIACASCHKQDNGFSDPLVLSDGFDGGKTGRHSMGLVNARFYSNGSFFWDERAASLEEQVLMPIQDPVEMGLSLDTLVARVSNQPYYPFLFTNAFGDETVNTDRISDALAQFVRSIMSYQSRYDQGRAQVAAPNLPFPNYTQQENQGKNLFFNPQLGGCAGCHGTEGFVAPGPRNNGLDATNAIDQGVGGVNGVPALVGLFKSPSLRNISMRAPYMHDGRFATLNEVIDHYSTGVQNNPNLSAPLRQPDGTIKRMNFTAAEKAALIAFLNTLDDTSLATDEKFSDPFLP
jgi:cytochrome c peroxidase